MSEMWVAVSCGFGDAVFSHRATSTYTMGKHEALRPFDHLLDESAWRVRRGLAGTLPPQTPTARPDAPLSEHEKLRAIEKIVDEVSFHGQAVTIRKIREVLDR